jgi:HEAT repeat protein
VRDSHANAAAKRNLESLFVRLLEGQATPDAKDYACRQLSIVGSDAAVPPLARLLQNETHREIARFALERIPGKTADSALAKAAAESRGVPRIGLINTLARRGIRSPLYQQLLGDPDPATAAAAAYAIADTGGAADAAALLQARALDAALRLAGRLGPPARSVYEALWSAKEPPMIRLAAMEGLARLDGAKFLPALLRAVQGDEPRLAAASIQLAAAHGGQAELLKLLPALPAEAQVRVITALSESGYAPARRTLLDLASSSDADVRVAALTGLAHIGGAEAVLPLARRAASAEGAEQAAARAALARVRGEESSRAVAEALALESGPPKLELIRAAAARGLTAAAPQLIEAARSAERDVRRESVRALREIAPASAAPELVKLLAEETSAAARRELEPAVAAVFRRHPDAPLAPLLARHAAAASAEEKASLLSVLGATAREEALPPLRAALSDTAQDVRRAAILALAEWPSAAPAAPLLESAQADAAPTLRILALRGYIKVVSLPSDRPPAAVAAQLAAGLKAATQAAEKKSVLAALVRFVCPESLALAKTLADDPEVGAEAKSAAARLANSLTYRR